ncbi:MAG TPA: putative baseplate assembly protein [Acidisarcina sp.]
MIYTCCNEARKAAVLGNPTLNGIDYLEVLDHDAIALNSPRQQTLLVHCLKPVPTTLAAANVLITGGESITGITALWIAPATTPPASANALEAAYFTSLSDSANVLVIRTSVAGDFSTYTLRLVNDATEASADPFVLTAVLDSFDPQLAEVCFRFKVECPNFDCAPSPFCPPDIATPPPIDYLAKDYGSFRTVMLDRLNQLLPGWGATSEADLGIALAELIAYVGDRLSYQQDAIATEAYIETARSRISLRRHALLVDYTIHDGCNARTWMQLQVAANPGEAVFLDRKLTRCYTYAPGMPSTLAVGAGNEEAARLSGVQVFEPMQDANLYSEHNLISLYTWGDKNCCLPAGATEATLYGSLPNLAPGDVLIFEEVLGPRTGDPADADIRHRYAVRLTQVTTKDGHGNPLIDPLFEDKTGKPITAAGQQPTPVTEVQWGNSDALPGPVCISSSYIDAKGDEQTASDVSIVRGNVVLADHGLTFPSVLLGTVPQPTIYLPADPAADHCVVAAPVPLPVRYRPLVPDSPITQAVPLQLVAGAAGPGEFSSSLSAADLMAIDASAAIPVIELEGTLNGVTHKWEPAHDLLESGEFDRRFVVEIEANTIAALRFGNKVNGASPESGTLFTTSYRIGNGTSGNVGADTLRFLARGDARIQTCRNPLPGQGGLEPETNDQIRRRAPQAFLTQERAITMADYEAIAERKPQVERAVATLRWTGSWHTVLIAAEPYGGGTLAPSTRKSLKKFVNRYRLAGQDLEIDSPQYVPLDIALNVCVDPNYFQADVEQGLLQLLGNQQLPNGTKGLFYPDSFTFGQTVYLSPIYAAARSVAGVTAVTATVFQPEGVATNRYLNAGEIKLGPLQIARMQNDPSFPNHGRLTIDLEGGK